MKRDTMLIRTKTPMQSKRPMQTRSRMRMQNKRDSQMGQSRTKKRTRILVPTKSRRRKDILWGADPARRCGSRDWRSRRSRWAPQLEQIPKDSQPGQTKKQIQRLEIRKMKTDIQLGYSRMDSPMEQIQKDSQQEQSPKDKREQTMGMRQRSSLGMAR